jgi:hypothetical protein
VGTDRFREDVSEALKKFVRSNPGQTPRVLKVNCQDALNWQTAEQSKLLTKDFVESSISQYVNSIPWQKSTLRCRVELLNADDESPTCFE